MTIKDFQFISNLDTGSTYENELINHFKIDKTKSVDNVSKDLEVAVKVVPRVFKGNSMWLNKKKYIIEKDFLNCSYEQFTRLDSLLAENDNINNLHKLLSIYVRPYSWWRLGIEKFYLKKQDIISNELLKMDMNDAQGIILFFFANANLCLRNINIRYLNLEKMAMSIWDRTRPKLTI